MADVVSRIDEELRHEVSEIASQLTQWVTEQKAAADSVATKARTVLQADKENIETLRADQQALVQAEEQLQHQGRDERQQVAELRSELERLTAAESRLPPEQQRLTQQLSQSRSMVMQAEGGVVALLRAKDHKLAELDRGIGLYKSRLGLNFEKVGDDRLRLTFTMLDPNHNDRPFFVEVRVTAGDRYVVESCEPLVPDLQSLTDDLNASNDFSAYVRAIRQRFKALV